MQKNSHLQASGGVILVVESINIVSRSKKQSYIYIKTYRNLKRLFISSFGPVIVIVCISSFRPCGCFCGGGGGLGVGGGLYGDASGREWGVEVGTNSTGAQDASAS